MARWCRATVPAWTCSSDRWRRPREDGAAALDPGDFDAVIDRQGELESEAFRPYAEIAAQSLVDELGLPPDQASRIGANAGRWPLFADSAAALQRLRTVAPC